MSAGVGEQLELRYVDNSELAPLTGEQVAILERMRWLEPVRETPDGSVVEYRLTVIGRAMLGAT